ncbi:sigma-E factor negative regulatory protein [Cellvibrio sp. NN19]|uniref:sigma-E factor negative regulatory protein n=1 Tax=Cellvibrio chitinivorans TaxID=3102792 RepID=UPI002B417498|nr:sigma-E factor negative regulatory protein [Cellvibrio sp. NN19]
MTEQIQPPVLAESLSALMDNQASELEIQRLLKALESDPQIKTTWSRYQLASAGLKGDLPIMASSDFAARVSAAIDAEESYSIQPQVAAQVSQVTQVEGQASNVVALPSRWWQQVGRAAVAASVAGALIVGVQQYQSGAAPQSAEFAANPTVTTPVTATTETKAANLPSGINAPALSARTVAVQSGYESRPQENRRVMFVPRQEAAPIYNEEVSTYVNQLIQEHTDNASSNSGQGMLPYTRVILVEEE